MHDELHQFKRNDVWSIVPHRKDVNIIDTKWIFHNKMDEEENVVRNKAKLVAQGYTQLEKELTLMKHLPLLLGLNP